MSHNYNDYVLEDFNIIHISPTYYKDLVGGGERYPWELVKALSNYIKVKLIVFGNKRKTKYYNENLTVEIYPALTSFSPFITKTNPFPTSLDYLKEIKEFNIVHIHQFNTLVAQIVIQYARNKDKLICLTDHGGGYFKLSKIFPSVAKTIDLYLLVSKFAFKKFESYQPKYKVIYGGVNLSKFKPISNVKDNQILSVGKILEVKGLDILISSIQKLDTNLKINAKLLDKNYYKYLLNLDKNNKASFNFNATDINLLNDYNSSLVTVLPSRSETLSLVVLESMACGTPVICSNVGGMPEIVEDGKTGFLVPPEDIKSLREKIQYFLDNPKESNRMGKNAYNKVLKDFTWDSVAKRCLSGYDEIIHNKLLK